MRNQLSLIPKITTNNNMDVFGLFPKSLFEEFFFQETPIQGYGGLTDKGKYYEIELELPRFKKENVKITKENGMIHVVAEQDNRQFYHSMNIPKFANPGEFSAKLEDGVLTIKVLKTVAAHPEVIEIK